MQKMNGLPVEVDTPNGKGFLEDILLTDLGYIQFRIKYPSEIEGCATFIKYTITTLDSMCEGSPISLLNKAIVEEDIIVERDE